MKWYFEELDRFDERFPHIHAYLIYGHSETFGGYPNDGEIMGDYLIVASSDDFGKPSLDKYLVADLIEWERAALELLSAESDYDLIDAIHDTWPTEATECQTTDTNTTK